jgi:hypothetical protein
MFATIEIGARSFVSTKALISAATAGVSFTRVRPEFYADSPIRNPAYIPRECLKHYCLLTLM